MCYVFCSLEQWIYQLSSDDEAAPSFSFSTAAARAATVDSGGSQRDEARKKLIEDRWLAGKKEKKERDSP